MARTKISKLAKDLNVALPTVVEYLRKNNIDIDDNPNASIEDDVYAILMKEFKSDKDLKNKSEQQGAATRQKDRVTAVKETPKPQEEEPKKEAQPFAEPRKPKILGTIDLNALGTPVIVKKPAQPEAKPATEVVAEPNWVLEFTRK